MSRENIGRRVEYKIGLMPNEGVITGYRAPIALNERVRGDRWSLPEIYYIDHEITVHPSKVIFKAKPVT